jgi:RNA-binding protein
MKRELSLEQPTIWVGKEGASTQTMNEISRQLEKRKIVKVQILKSALKDESAKDIALKTAQQTESTLIDVRGHTFILHKPRKKRIEKPL